MNRDDIIRLAREAAGGMLSYDVEGEWRLNAVEVERFAVLVATAERESMRSEGWRQCAVGQRTTQYCGQLEKAVEAEREACARVVEEHAQNIHGYDKHEYAAAIRARGEDNAESNG